MVATEVVRRDEMVRPDVRHDVVLETRHGAEPEAEAAVVEFQERAGVSEMARLEMAVMAEVARLEIPVLAEMAGMERLAVAPDVRWRAEVGREMAEARAAVTGLDR